MHSVTDVFGDQGHDTLPDQGFEHGLSGSCEPGLEVTQRPICLRKESDGHYGPVARLAFEILQHAVAIYTGQTQTNKHEVGKLLTVLRKVVQCLAWVLETDDLVALAVQDDLDDLPRRQGCIEYQNDLILSHRLALPASCFLLLNLHIDR